jgi:hypothetical protein
MAKSDRTIEEFEATAMLLGMWYDSLDHTFNKNYEGDVMASQFYDADTMEEIYLTHLGRDNAHRKQLVKDKHIGAKDA